MEGKKKKPMKDREIDIYVHMYIIYMQRMLEAFIATTLQTALHFWKEAAPKK